MLKLDGGDPGYIVIDEMAGMFVTMAGHKATILNILIGFVLFRVFDIIKPYPIKKIEGLGKGYGIVADDILAGIFANLVLVVWGKFAWC
jgi:phosphatidylglycerophosphatase A